MLYLIPTPIGNLEDISLRALRLLKEVDLILAEDTRITRKLLAHYDIHTPLKAYHAHNEHRLTASLVAQMEAGSTFALVSDAGTPAISDPGFLLVQACVAAGVTVSCLPGSTAFVPALVGSGLPCDRFFFEGFLPHKKGRRSRLRWLSELPYTFVLYESPHRLAKCLRQLVEYCGAERPACVVRELSKLHEEYVHGTLAQLIAHFEAHPPRGELVVVVGGLSSKKPKAAGP